MYYLPDSARVRIRGDNGGMGGGLSGARVGHRWPVPARINQILPAHPYRGLQGFTAFVLGIVTRMGGNARSAAQGGSGRAATRARSPKGKHSERIVLNESGHASAYKY